MKILRYFFVGGISAVIDISLFTIFAGYFKFPWFIVSVITFTIATVDNYLLSIRFVFESGSRYKKHHEILGVFIVSTITLLLNQMFLYLFIEKMNIHLVFFKVLNHRYAFFVELLRKKKIYFFCIGHPGL